MATQFPQINLTLRNVKSLPLTFAEGDANLSSLKTHTQAVGTAVNGVEQELTTTQQTVNSLNIAVSGFDGRISSLEISTEDLQELTTEQTNLITALQENSLKFFGDVIGGSTQQNPVVMNGFIGFAENSLYRVSSSGWFIRSGVLFSAFCDVGDLIIVTETAFLVVKSSDFVIVGSDGVSVTQDENVSGSTIVSRGWSIDLSETTYQRITNVETISSDAMDGVESNSNSIQDLENRVSTLETNITSPFLYKGTITAGPTQLDPFLISSITPTPSIGNYYRVISAGYVQDAEKTVFINVGDGILFKDSTTIEVFDNSDPLTSGTTDYISVTGNTDEGFVVDIDSAFKQRMTDAESGITGLDGRLDTAEGSISDHETRISTLESVPPFDPTTINNTLSDHETRIGDLETDVGDHETRIATLESTSTTLLYATKASARVSFTTTDPDQMVDSFDSTVLKTAKYVIQAELTDGSMHASEILVTNNATTVFITEYAKLNNGTDLVTYSADFNGTLVELYVTPANTNTTITFARTAIKKV
jgi:hypothetical protein